MNGENLDSRKIFGKFYINFFIESLFRSFITLDITYLGTEEKEIKLSEDFSIIDIKLANNAYIKSNNTIVFKPTRENSESRIRIVFAGGVKDSGWIYYPLMTATCNVKFWIPTCNEAVVNFIFPPFIHPLPQFTHFLIEKNEIELRCEHVNYPEVQLVYYYFIKNRDKAKKKVEFVSLFRESALSILIPTIFPFLLNFIVILLGFTTIPPSIKIPVAIGIIPLYFTFWNWSNMLKCVPAFTNLITTLILAILFFNLSFSISWAIEHKLISWIIFTIVSIVYVITACILFHNVLEFIFYPFKKEKMILLKIQKKVEVYFYNKLPKLLGGKK